MNSDNTSASKIFNRSDFIQRIKSVRTTRWIRFGIVAAIFIAWVAWLGNWWVALFLFLLFDIYITGYIPLSWWKKSPNPTVRAVMGWVDAIVYALVLVYFIFTFLGQNYQIPSSSLEKTLLTGDYLLVDKITYGPRVPMTPVHFPLVQNTFPIINTKSYTEWPRWRYHRLKGLRNIEKGDIVVFNFPAGDTVALKIQNPDYYTLVRTVGRDRIYANPEAFGEVMYRPVDRRENYVKRAVGLPGETLRIINGEIFIDGKQQKMPANAQFNYFFLVNNWRSLTPTQQNAFWDSLGVNIDDRGHASNDPNVLYAPLTADMVSRLHDMDQVEWVERAPTQPDGLLYPMDKSMEWQWSVDNYGPIRIPAKGMTVELNDSTWALYGRCIRNYEHNDAELRGNTVYIDGKPASDYTFGMDYYFMMGDNRHNSLDSRFWGFVPEDHIVGRPVMVIASFDKDRGLFNGGLRLNRIFRTPNPDK